MLLRDDSFVRPQDLGNRADPAVLFARSYLLIRTIVGLIGIVLPFVFILGEAFFLRAGVHVRGSISAYYHTSMRDIFVGGLCVIGFLLASYMAGQNKRTDYTLSLVAGVAVIGVALFPTSRPGLAADAPRCGTMPAPSGCTPVQQWLGETLAASVHFSFAAVFILCLAAICFYFANHEVNRPDGGSARAARLQRSCGVVILAAVGWVGLGGILGATIWELTPLYLGEVVSVWAFALSWLVNGRAWWERLKPRRAVVEATEAHGEMQAA